jgi:hypothetical protein
MNNDINDDLNKLINGFLVEEKIICSNNEDIEDISKRLTEKILNQFVIYKNVENTRKIYNLEILPEKNKEIIEKNKEIFEKNKQIMEKSKEIFEKNKEIFEMNKEMIFKEIENNEIDNKKLDNLEIENKFIKKSNLTKIENLKLKRLNVDNMNLDNDIKEIINMDNEEFKKRIKNRKKKNIEDQINIESIINIKNQIDINNLDIKNDIENIKELIYKDKSFTRGKRLRNAEGTSKVYLFLDYIIRLCNDTQCKNEYECLNKFGSGLNKEVNIVMPYYIELDNKELNFDFSIQPYIKNTITLDEYIKLKKYTNEILIKHFYELCKIIEYMHNKDIVHGDLKPNNILINSKNDLYLIDYGLSGLDKISSGTGGTKPFCAPETLNTSETEEYVWRQNKKENDVWSIGIIYITIFLFNTIYHYYSEYPKDFFDSIGYINEKYINKLDTKYYELFKSIFKKNRSNISEIKNILEKLL